jgi:hypothetical protein
MTIWLASVDTEHFTFEGYGETRSDAMAALGRAFARHAEQYRLASDWARPHEATYREIELGAGYRDRHKIT